MTEDVKAELRDKLERAANMLLCDTIPEPWPDWMTPEKRAMISERFRGYAAELAA